MNVEGFEELGPWKLKVDSIDLKYIYIYEHGHRISCTLSPRPRVLRQEFQFSTCIVHVQ
jgi:hypothetical protein